MEYYDDGNRQLLAKTINLSYLGYKYTRVAHEIIDMTDGIFHASYFADKNWDDTNSYDRLSDLTRIEWRWEFLRRNELYRRFYLIYISKDMSNKFFNYTQDRFSLDEFLGNVFHLENVPNPRRGLNSIRRSASEWEFSPRNMFEPDFEGTVKFIESRREKRIRYHGEDITTLLRSDPLVFYATLDPRADTDEQLNYLRHFLEREKKFKLKRIHQKKFPAYIRALDAMDMGITKAEFANTSKHKAKTYHSGRDTYSTAQRLRTDFISIS
ncbi:transcriptional regulator domain-containing protein [Bosea sp. BH3]|uniref:transcriptional regulator domain-containing protein n=1 Tax=Bosea sp. BH3 TaxID=2871701 RepID=UPI0021CB5A0C|nr:DUF6499 domain-containing protein [Bosea sp. BH3]MCU4179691.1 DUF6499 domain-containing protein [Bosea sp. BH3]